MLPIEVLSGGADINILPGNLIPSYPLNPRHTRNLSRAQVTIICQHFGNHWTLLACSWGRDNEEGTVGNDVQRYSSRPCGPVGSATSPCYFRLPSTLILCGFPAPTSKFLPLGDLWPPGSHFLILARLPLVFWSLIPWGPLLPQVLRHHDHLSGSIRAALPGIGLWHNSVEISRYLRGKLQMWRHQSYGFATLFWLKWHLQYLQAGQPSMVLVSVDSSKLSHV